jgi:hypothetical protein
MGKMQSALKIMSAIQIITLGIAFGMIGFLIYPRAYSAGIYLDFPLWMLIIGFCLSIAILICIIKDKDEIKLICPKCGQVNLPSQQFCGKCGQQLSQSTYKQ